MCASSSLACYWISRVYFRRIVAFPAPLVSLSMLLFESDELEVMQIIKTLKSKRASGHDELSAETIFFGYHCNTNE